MAEHLLEPTMPAEAAALAAYYACAPGAAGAGPEAFAGTVPRVREDLDPGLAQLLGLSPRRPPDEEAIAHILAGHRADGTPVPGQHTQGRTVSFVDLCFSADKSVSLAALMAPTAAERALLHAVHREAVAATMATIKTVLGRARRGRGGRNGAEAGRIAWIAFDHMTSRPTTEIADQDPVTGETFTHLATVRVAGTPQVHTHVCVPSVVLTASGHVGGLDLAELRGRVREWGGLYQAHLATGLRRLGVEVGLDPKTGAARLAAVPEPVRAAFSRRTAQGEAAARAYAASQGLDWDSLPPRRRVGLLKQGTQGDPRAAKTDDLGDVASWRAQAAAVGWEPGSVINLDRPTPLPSRPERLAIARAAAEPVLAQAFTGEAVLDGSEARVAAARGLIASGVLAAEEIDDVAQALVSGGIPDGETRASVIAREVPGPRGETAIRLTTGAHVARENRLVTLARAAAADRSSALTVAEVEVGAAAAGLNLTGPHGEAQASAMRAVGTGGRVGVLVGAAGAGKTALVSGLRAAWAAQGRTVIGTAVAWRQAQALTEAGIPEEQCIALAALLARARAGTLRLDRESVVVIDETSLASVRNALDLLELREAVGFTLIAIGDPHQGRSVEAGGTVQLLTRALGGAIAEVATTIRQRTARERDLANRVRAGQVTEVLDVLREEGRARLAPGTLAEATEAIADLWQERVAAVGEEAVLVLAPTRADCRAVGAAIRRRRQASAKLGPDLVTVEAIDQAGDIYEIPLAIGDRVRLYGKTYARGAGAGLLGVNGSVVEVRGVRTDGLVLRAAGGREGLVSWAALRDRETGRIRIGEGTVQSLAAGQGVTSEEAILACPRGSEGVDLPQLYVGLTRHRSTSWIVLGEGAERRAVSAHRPLGDARPIRAADLWGHAAQVFAQRPRSELATELLERAHAARRAAEDTFRRGLARMEARAARGLAPTALPGRARRRRLALALGSLHEKVRTRAEMLAGIATQAATMAVHIRRVADVARASRTPGMTRRPGRGAPAPRF